MTFYLENLFDLVISQGVDSLFIHHCQINKGYPVDIGLINCKYYTE